MRRILTILTGLGIGAALMYLLDPEGGNRRRALLRDKAVKLNRQTKETIEGTVRDLSNRAKGTFHGIRSTIENDRNDHTADSGWSNGPAF